MNLFFSELLQTLGVVVAAYVVFMLVAMTYKRWAVGRAQAKGPTL